LKNGSLPFIAILTLSAFIILTGFSRSEDIAQPSWIKPGASIVYHGSLSIGGEGVLEATVRWSVKSMDADTITLEACIESSNLRTSISRIFKVSAATGRLLSIDDEIIDTGRFFLWLYPPPDTGDIVEIEGLPYRVSGIESINASNRIWSCIVVNSTVDDPYIRGIATRWYDRETGIQVKVYMNLSFSYIFKGSNTTSSAEADLILVSASI